MIDFYLLWKMNFRKTFLWGGKLMNRILPVKQKSAFEKTKAQNNKEHSFAFLRRKYLWTQLAPLS